MPLASGGCENVSMLTVDLPGAVLGFIGVHLGLRSEVATLVRAVDDGDLALADRRARLLQRVLGHHHHAEDAVLFPAVRARQPGAETTTAELEAQHVELDAALAALFDDATTIEGVRTLLERHLAAEEQQVLPLWLASFSADEHERFAHRLKRATPIRDAGLMISWLLDVAPHGALDVAWAQVPPSLRVLHRVWWRRRYERAFGAGVPAVAPAGTVFGLGLATAA
jgi:hypothetical protein